ncbi:MAG TPA: S41 family peptidase [Patescibacteria group bacterium]|nr:S41 family peptidase [Patescibacteria group bacterium]
MPKVNIIRLRKIFISTILVVLIFSGGYYLGKQGYKASFTKLSEIKIERNVPLDKNVDFNLFWKVWDVMVSDYFDKTKINPKEMVYGAIRGMVSAIGDPYTVFLPPEENKVVQEDLQGSFQGVGIQIGFRGTQLAVIAPLPKSPAEEAGVKPGDYIIGIKDENKKIDVSTSGMSLPDAVEIIRGSSGTKVTLTLLRDGSDKPIVVDIVRKDINVPSVILSFEGKEKDIANVKLLKFAGETNGEWEKTVRDILKNKPKGIILDLRNNPGGYLQGAVDIAGEFLPNNTLVVYEAKSNGTKNEFRTDKFPRLANIPMVILVNKGSASASEILAGALRDQAKIKLVGDTTFGKGTIQEPRQVDGGAGLHITVAKWLTPKETWVNGQGLEPDVKLEDNSETKEDEQFDKAIEVLNVGK